MTALLTALRWTARILALTALAFVLIFLIGEGPPNPLNTSIRENLLLASFALLIAGLILGWFSEPWGAALVLADLIAFYLINRIASGHWPRGPWFFLLALPGLLYALTFLLARTTTPDPNDTPATNQKSPPNSPE